MLFLLYDDHGLVSAFDFIQPLRSIASLLFVALFKVDAIDAYIYTIHTECVSVAEEPAPVCNVSLCLDLNWEWKVYILCVI